MLSVEQCVGAGLLFPAGQTGHAGRACNSPEQGQRFWMATPKDQIMCLLFIFTDDSLVDYYGPK